MGRIRAVILAIGLLWLFIANGMDTIVTTGWREVGGQLIEPRTVPNIGLMDDRRNQLLIAAVILVFGAIFVAADRMRNRGNGEPSVRIGGNASDSPPGDLDLASVAYRSWLVEFFRITKNDVLEEYIV